MSNKSAKEKLIELYGAECFIEKLHLRPLDDPPKRFTGVGQMKKSIKKAKNNKFGGTNE